MPENILRNCDVGLIAVHSLEALRERLCDEPTQHLPYRLCGACDGDVNGHRHIRATLMHLTLTRGRIAVTLWVCRRLNVDF